MHPYLQVVILDELSISDDDLEKIGHGQTSEMEESISDDDLFKINAGRRTETEETLAWLANNTAITLAALSSSSLLDRSSYSAAAVTETKLDEMITRSGFEAAVTLKHIMRSSQNIASATSPDSVNQTWKGSAMKPSIAPGASSTVPGARPRAMVYKYTPDVDHSKLARFVTQHLRTVDTERLKCVVLTDRWISPRKLSVKLRQRGITPSCYDGGVEMFHCYDRPKYREGGAGDGGEAELSAWLGAEAGVLVTSEHQFRGCEADTVIYVATCWGDYINSNSRSPVTRAVAGLTLVTGDWGLSVPELRRDWDVEIVEEGAGERQ